MDRWHFDYDSDRGWRWLRVRPELGVLDSSSRGFPTIEQCYADAVAVGYRSPKPPAIPSWLDAARR